MNKLLALTALLASVYSLNARANLNVYECKLTNGQGSASLVVYADGGKVNSVDWMPEDGLKTTKANVGRPAVNPDGTIEFTLFGFQDQRDVLSLPAAAATLATDIKISTFHDNDDEFVDYQYFTCHGNK